MGSNKTVPTTIDINSFLATVSNGRRDEARIMINMMKEISGEEPIMWGPSIIGFGTQHYRYESGREGDMPQLAFSPRKAKFTIYFEGFDDYKDLLLKLGKYRHGVSCLYINNLTDIDLNILRKMLQRSFAINNSDDSSDEE